MSDVDGKQLCDILRLNAGDSRFSAALDTLISWDSVSNTDVEGIVSAIITDVRQQGDSALLEYTNRFDCRDCSEFHELCINTEQMNDALKTIDDKTRQALQQAATRIQDYHAHQLQSSWEYEESDGTILGQQISAIERVGIYVPGGKASYPSSVLMNAIPARVAGVKDIIMVVPAPRGVLSPMVLAAAALAGVTKIFTIGGAQAIAALAYGTQSVPKVDKIVGPGNSYVATAKRFVFGTVGLDMVAGPSEILVICDGKTDPDWIAMDLFSQAEHDEQAQSILISWDAAFIDSVHKSMTMLLPQMERAAII
jgi:histidinol dehydrogenase